MKLSKVLACSLVGMLVACTTTYAVVPPGGAAAQDAPLPSKQVATAVRAPVAAAPPLSVDSRVGHARVSRAGDRRTFVLVEVSARPGAALRRQPASSALVIDQSGSMAGERIERARQAALGWVERAADGDLVSVTGFETTARQVASPARLSAGSRPALALAIEGLGVGGGTCLSCGIERALDELPVGDERVQRMVVLSDGMANAGVVDEHGFRQIAAACRQRGIGVTTVGLGVGYDAALLSALSEESNGNHYFVENERDLAAVFEQELDSVRATVASGVRAEITLGSGVRLVRVLSRAHDLAGGRVIVPLGALPERAQRTVLLEVELPDGIGDVEVASVTLRHDQGASASQVLSATMVDGAASVLDPLVAMRLGRDGTARAIDEASSRFDRGDRDGALSVLDEHARWLGSATRSIADDRRAGEIRADFARQLSETSASRARFATAAPNSSEGHAATRAARVRSFMQTR